VTGNLQGKLSEHLPPRLLNFLFERQETGILRLSRQGLTKTLYVVSGVPVNAESTSRDETLGRYLIKSGRIREEDYEKSIALMLSQGVQQGAALVKLGCLKPKELYQEVKSHTREKALAAFSWSEGEYHFEAEVGFVEDLYRFEFQFYPLLAQGVLNHLPLGAIERELVRVPLLPLAPADDLLDRIAAFALNEAASAFVIQIDGQKLLPALCEQAPDPRLAHRLLYLLLLTGLVGPSGQPCREIREVVVEEKAAPSPPAYLFLPTKETAPEVEEELPMEEALGKGQEAILTAYIEIKSLDLFAVLGVGRDTGDPEVEQAYRRRMDEFDRDQFQKNLPAEAEAKLEEINTRLIRAYESLKTAARRQGYLAQLEEVSPQKQARRRLESEKFLQEGMKCVRSRDFARAQEMFEKAIQLRPQEPEYYGYLGWTIYMNPALEEKVRRARAEEKVRMAIQMNPRLDSARVFLGKIFKDQGRMEEAVAQFRAAVECNPNCREASRELKVYEQSRKGS